MIGFLGGTGPEGRGLALRLALAGEDVIIGSRDGSRAAAAAEEVAGLAPGAVVEGALNEETAARTDVVFIAVPYSAQRPTIEPLAGHLAGKGSSWGSLYRSGSARAQRRSSRCPTGPPRSRSRPCFRSRWW